MPDKGLYYQGRCRHKDEDLAGRDEGLRRRLEIPKVRWVNQAGEYKCVGRMRKVYIVKRDWVKGKGKGGR